MTLRPAGLAFLVLLACPASADIITLDGGMTVDGIVTERGDKVEVRIGEGTLFYRKDVVRSIKRTASALGEFEQRRAALKPGDAEGHYQLGLWCETRKLMVPARAMFDRAVAIAPKHAGANERLGNTLVGGEWFKEFDYQESRGNVRVRGGWLPREVARARDELVRMDNEARAGAIEAYYLRLQREAQASSAQASGCGADLSPSSAGPWIADTLWPTGSKLRIVFQDGTPERIEQVKTIASEWTRHANLDFDFAPLSEDASQDDIRITFAGVGAHSQLGRNSIAYARRKEPSMTLNPVSHATSPEAWRRTILHEFGHALGFLHEHQNPNRNFQWNEEAVQKHFAQFGMSKQEIEDNVLKSPVQGQATAPGGKQFDPDSIMMYALPKETNSAGVATRWNTQLSPVDRETAAALYPGRGVHPRAPRRPRHLRRGPARRGGGGAGARGPQAARQRPRARPELAAAGDGRPADGVPRALADLGDGRPRARRQDPRDAGLHRPAADRPAGRDRPPARDEHGAAARAGRPAGHRALETRPDPGLRRTVTGLALTAAREHGVRTMRRLPSTLPPFPGLAPHTASQVRHDGGRWLRPRRRRRCAAD
jgi:hypothetical protein